jgi:diguanylate cyclase
MIWTDLSPRRRVSARPAPAMMAAMRINQRSAPNAPGEMRRWPPSQASVAGEARRAPSWFGLPSEIGPSMTTSRFFGSPARAAYALVAVLLAALALTALGAFIPDQAISALRPLIPGQTPFLELLVLGWGGVALGRLTIGAEANAAQRGPATRSDTGAREEKVDRVLRHIAKVLQVHLADSESFSERLDGANERLSRQNAVGPIKDIVLALIEDNRDMRDRLHSVRNQLEDSRLQVVQLQTNLERAEEAGLRDVVTAIGNRRFFDACFPEEVEKARRAGDSICLALGDIDKFKQVNDRFGHLVGDRLLRLFANILVQNLRGQDKVARFGGEEFALIFPGARLADAETAVERIRGVLESKQWTIEPSGERVGRVTASFGVAALRANESATDLLQRADRRLYEAKAHGRNCVVADSETGQETGQASPSRRPSASRRAAAG